MIWSNRAKGFLPAIPAKDWLAERTLSPEQLSGVAAASYRIKHGESVWLQLPNIQTHTLCEISRYFHGARTDSLLGYQRSSWFNTQTMTSRTELISFCRSLYQFKYFQKYPDLGTERFRVKDPVDEPKRIASTWLADSNSGLTSICESLSVRLFPFLIIIDLTPLGHKNNPSEVIEHVESYFPQTPKLYLSLDTDFVVNRSIGTAFTKLKTNIQTWRQTKNDNHQWISEISSTSSPKIKLIEVPDTKLDQLLLNSLALCKEFKELLQNHPALLKRSIPIAYRVINTLRGLSIPLSYHEFYMDQHRQYGMFPSLPLTEWIKNFSDIPMPFGSAEASKLRIVESLNTIIKLLLHPDSQTGKSQSLDLWLSSRTDSLIITSSEREALLLQHWLVMSPHSHKNHRVLAAGSVRQMFKLLDTHFSSALILNPLWESEFYFLSMATQVDWLCYPRELLWHDRELQTIFSQTKTDQPKIDWWDLLNIGIPDLYPNDLPSTIESFSSCNGRYPKFFTIEISAVDNPDWIKQLMQMGEPTESACQIDVSDTSLVSVFTESGNTYKYHPNHKIFVLDKDDNIDTQTASELQPGMIMLESIENEQSSDLFEMLVDHVASSNPGYSVSITHAKSWFAFVDAAFLACSKNVNELHKKLHQNQIEIGKETVKAWVQHLVLHPHHPETVMKALSIIAGQSKTKEEIRIIANAQRISHGLRTNLGKEFRKMVRGNYSERISVQSDNLFDFTLLHDILILETIDSVIHNPVPSHIIPAKETISDILHKAVNSSNGRLVATTQAFKSAQASNFVNLEKLTAALTLLKESFYYVFVEKNILLSDALTVASTYDIGYAGATSEQTKGRYQTYRRVYNEKIITIDKHLKLGNSRDPKHCFRIYFHVDIDSKQIVIHHAGRHLPN